MSSLSQSERDAAREKIIADIAAASTLCSSLASVFPSSLDDEADAAMRCKVTAKRFDYKPKIEQLERKCEMLRVALSGLLDRKEQAVQLCGELDSRHQQDLVMLGTKAFDLQQRGYQLQAVVKGLQGEVRRLAGEKEAMVRELGETVEGKEKVEIVMREYERAKQERERRVEELEAAVRSLELKVEELVNARDDMGQVLLTQEKEIAAQLEARRRAEEEAVRLRAALQTSEAEQAEQKENIYNLEKLRGELIKSMEKSLADLSKSRLETADRERVIAEVKAALAEKAETAEAFRREVARVGKEKAELEAELQRAVQEWEERCGQQSERLSAELSLTRKVKEDELQSLRQRLGRREEELAHLQKSFDDAEGVRGAIQAELSASREAVLRERRERSSTENGLVRVQQELKYCEMELEGKREELRLLEKSRDKERRLEEERREEAKRLQDEAEQRLAAAHDEAKQRERELKQTHTALASLTSQHQQLTAAFSQLTEDKTALQCREELLTGQLGSLTSDLTSLTERSGAEAASLRTDREEWKARYEGMRDELDSFKQYAGVSDKDQLERLVRLSVEAETLRRQVADKGELSSRLMEAERRVAELTKRVHDGDRRRRDLHNAIQELKGNVRVMVRVRPGADAEAIECSDDEKRLKLVAADEGGKSATFAFDHVFPPAAKQAEVFDEVSALIQSALDGYHVCLFSYGQTGSGKTFTMTGALTGEASGIIPRSVAQILSSARSYREEGWQFVLEASFLEIYNETVRDLLCSKQGATLDDDGKTAGGGLDVKRDADGRTVVPGSVRMAVSSEGEIVEILKLANRHRAVAATGMNARSSRSHSIFTLFLTGSNAAARTQLTGSLNLCDLAGSERLSRSHAEGTRLKETQAINKSLSALADVFTALGSGSKHVPYRNSRLTWMLQPCLSGDGKTLMIVNVSPDRSDAGETQCSLRFASQVNQCELGKPRRNNRLMEKETEDDRTDAAQAAQAAAAAAAEAEHNRSGSGSGVMAAASKKPTLKQSMGRK